MYVCVVEDFVVLIFNEFRMYVLFILVVLLLMCLLVFVMIFTLSLES